MLNKKNISIHILLIAALLFVMTSMLTSSVGYSQSLADDLSDAGSQNGSEYDELFTEYIKIIGNSRRIFVITNESGRLNKGDFISIVMNDRLTARALVAKNKDNFVGIKILRIDSLANWARITKGLAVQILKGDDSSFKTRQSKPTKLESGPEIKNEEDLFSSTILTEDIGLDDKSIRALKTDNIFSIGLGFISVSSADGSGTASQSMFNASWSFQIADDIWIEAAAANSTLLEYPGSSIQTSLTHFTARFKYAFKAPLYSFILPYFGYRMASVSSPDAGVNRTGTTDTASLEYEQSLVSELASNKIIYGVTVFRRLVPGWFVRADLGNDIMNIGISIEF
jgi:hypothetical protein